MRFHILTLFPQMVQNGLSESILGRAQEKELFSVDTVNIRDFSNDKHKKVDDYPYGGGAGLLMEAEPVYNAYQSIISKTQKKVRLIYLTPFGRKFDQRMAEELVQEEDLCFLCGHYEGIDERVLSEIVTDYVSIGDFVLTGGELPAMIMIDAISRLIPDVLHNEGSSREESFSGYLLEYPQYTRPEVFRGMKVPKPLLSGNHKEIREWRKKASIERTMKYRPDLFEQYEKLQLCKEKLMKEKLRYRCMIELIVREQAELLFFTEDGIALKDRVSKVCMITVDNEESGIRICKDICKDNEIDTFVTFQPFLEELLKQYFDIKVHSYCYQMVYTKRESLKKSDYDIQKLSLKYLNEITSVYHICDKDYIAERLTNGHVYGIIKNSQLCAFIGEHQEGSMGMLYVMPQYRHTGLAIALEADLINRTLQKGYTPYCQILDGNEASYDLQKKLGLVRAKEMMWWLKRV